MIPRRLPLSFRLARFFVRIQNTAYHVAFPSNLFGGRQVYNYDTRRPISFQRNSNIPAVETELAVIRIGPAALSWRSATSSSFASRRSSSGGNA